jgi:hypothetical protein
MKVSVNIDQQIGAESFPSFPASRRFNRNKRCVGAKVARSHGLTDDPPRRCSPTFTHVRRNRYTFSKIIMRDDLETITLTSAISQRLGILIRIIKPKRQRTVTPSQPSPSADKSLLVFNPLGIERTETD